MTDAVAFRTEIVKLAREHRAFARMLMAELDRLADLKARQVQKLIESPQSFANISAWKGDKSRAENKEAMAALRRKLEKMGYRPIDSSATWRDTDTGELYGELSFLVPDMTSEEAFDLGREFNQDSVIYKSPKGVLAMYDTRGDNPKALLAHRADGSAAYKIQTEKPPKKEKGKGPRRKEREGEELFSRTRGVNFEFDFLWDHPTAFDGHTPLSVRRMQDVVGRAFPKPGGQLQRQWRDFLDARYDGGKKMVPNTNPRSQKSHPKVTMLTRMKTDEQFRRGVRREFHEYQEAA